LLFRNGHAVADQEAGRRRFPLPGEADRDWRRFHDPLRLRPEPDAVERESNASRIMHRQGGVEGGIEQRLEVPAERGLDVARIEER
jgi:hypothetical protein